MVVQALQVINQLTLKKTLSLIGYDNNDLSTASSHLLKTVIESITDLEHINDERTKYEAKRKADPASRMKPFPFIWEKIGK